MSGLLSNSTAFLSRIYYIKNPYDVNVSVISVLDTQNEAAFSLFNVVQNLDRLSFESKYDKIIFAKTVL